MKRRGEQLKQDRIEIDEEKINIAEQKNELVEERRAVEFLKLDYTRRLEDIAKTKVALKKRDEELVGYLVEQQLADPVFSLPDPDRVIATLAASNLKLRDEKDKWIEEKTAMEKQSLEEKASIQARIAELEAQVRTSKRRSDDSEVM